MILGAALVAVGTLGLVTAELTGRQALRRLFKPLGSSGFLLAALGAPHVRAPSGPGWLLLAGLVAAACGDGLLLGRTRRAVAGGMAAFALTYCAYGAWFVTRLGTTWLVAGSAAMFLALGHLAWRWLEPHVEAPLRMPVRAYVALASLVAGVAAASGAESVLRGAGLGTSTLLPTLGAVLLYASDAAVARERFVTHDWRNRAWGLPLYYGAQLLVASAVL